MLLYVGWAGGARAARSADIHVRGAMLRLILVLFFGAARLAPIVRFLVEDGDHARNRVIRSIIDATGAVSRGALARSQRPS